jgi:hypothetical protein
MQKGVEQGRILLNSVYYIDCSEEDAAVMRHSSAPLAIRPIINFSTQEATWATNSARGEYISWDEIGPNLSELAKNQKTGDDPIHVNDAPKEIVFTKQNHRVRLVELALDIFNQKVRPYVAAGKTLSFKNNEEVRKFFLTKDFEK